MLTVLAQAASSVETAVETTSLNGSQSLLGLIFQANILIQITLLLLIFFSVVSWAIIGSKHRQLKKSQKRSDEFLSSFWEAESIEKLLKNSSFRKSPAFNIFRAGVDAIREVKHPNRSVLVQREIRRAAEDEIEALETGLPFLATTGSASPFLGLFGTVWGILYAFWKIGRTGTSSLAVVGPHIAEALTTTALGLIAAIPAVVFYNYFVNKIRIFSKDLLDFSDDLYSRLENEYLSKE